MTREEIDSLRGREDAIEAAYYARHTPEYEHLFVIAKEACLKYDTRWTEQAAEWYIYYVFFLRLKDEDKQEQKRRRKAEREAKKQAEAAYRAAHETENFYA